MTVKIFPLKNILYFRNMYNQVTCRSVHSGASVLISNLPHCRSTRSYSGNVVDQNVQLNCGPALSTNHNQMKKLIWNIEILIFCILRWRLFLSKCCCHLWNSSFLPFSHGVQIERRQSFAHETDGPGRRNTPFCDVRRNQPLFLHIHWRHPHPAQENLVLVPSLDHAAFPPRFYWRTINVSLQTWTKWRHQSRGQFTLTGKILKFYSQHTSFSTN